jgi:hypothetical protein
MSYLGPLRLHFAGQFQAAVSTVNNEPQYFDNDAFKPSYQEPGEGKGAWNPTGDGDWRLIGCEVQSAWLPDGSATSPSDPVLAATIADSDRQAPAKLVDLDPWQQMVSTIWGLEVRIADKEGRTLIRGRFEPTPFYGIWQRVLNAPKPINPVFGAMYQSVLTEVSWGEVDDSPFLAALREAAPDNLLSVKFNVDGYDSDSQSPTFTLGRIVGTIGPAGTTEPHHLLRGRQLAPSSLGMGGLKPGQKVNFCSATVDEVGGKIYLDLGNALPTTTPGGELESPGRLSLHAGTEALCEIPPLDTDEYRRSAGVLALPPDRKLSAGELDAVSGSPLSIWVAGAAEPAAAEIVDYVRADSFVFRCDPGEKVAVRFVATHLGRPAAGATVALAPDLEQLQPPKQEAEEGVAPGVPADALKLPEKAKADADGIAVVELETFDPGAPRRYIDGQLYGIRPNLAQGASTEDPWNFVSVLLWSAFRPADPPTWYGDLQPIFQQYANLYPVMKGFLDLADWEAVWENRSLLLLAFKLGIEDPNSMPVTRDLSGQKRKAIIAWLENPDGPVLGEPPDPPRRPPADRTAQVSELQGEKGAALRRRPGHEE